MSFRKAHRERGVGLRLKTTHQSAARETESAQGPVDSSRPETLNARTHMPAAGATVRRIGDVKRLPRISKSTPGTVRWVCKGGASAASVVAAAGHVQRIIGHAREDAVAAGAAQCRFLWHPIATGQPAMRHPGHVVTVEPYQKRRFKGTVRLASVSGPRIRRLTANRTRTRPDLPQSAKRMIAVAFIDQLDVGDGPRVRPHDFVLVPEAPKHEHRNGGTESQHQTELRRAWKLAVFDNANGTTWVRTTRN